MSKHTDTVVESVLDLYLANPHGSFTVRKIAEHTGLSQSQVRAGIDGEHAQRLSRVQVDVPTYSRNYSGMQIGTTVAQAFVPSRSYLAKLLAEAYANLKNPGTGWGSNKETNS